MAIGDHSGYHAKRTHIFLGIVQLYGTVRLASGASSTALSPGRTVIGGSCGAQRCDTFNIEKSGEEHLCAEACR